MPSLYVSEYFHMASDSLVGARSNVIPSPPLVEQKIGITAGTSLSAAFSPQTRIIVVTTDTTCSVAFSTTTSITASTASQRIFQNEAPRFYTVVPSTFIAVIQST